MTVGTGRNLQGAYEKVAKYLAEDFTFQGKKVKVFSAFERNPKATEYPAVFLELASRSEKVISDYPYVADTLGVFKLTAILEVFDSQKGDWVGNANGMGVGQMDQAIRAALQGYLTLGSTVDWFEFGETTYVDRNPNRGAEFSIRVSLREAMTARVR